jgi:hypothetical protein
MPYCHNPNNLPFYAVEKTIWSDYNFSKGKVRREDVTRFTIEVASCRRSVIGTIFGILAIGDTSYVSFNDSINDSE